MDQDQRRTGAEKIGGSTLNFQSDGIYSPTKLTNKASWVQLFFTLNKHMITFSLFPFAFSPFSPLFSISPFPFLYFFPLFPSFLSEIYSPTPFTVRRQGGPLDPPDPLSRKPLQLPEYPTYGTRPGNLRSPERRCCFMSRDFRRSSKTRQIPGHVTRFEPVRKGDD